MDGRSRPAAERLPLVGHRGAGGRYLGPPVAPAPGERRRLRREPHGEKSRIGDQSERDAAASVQCLGVPVDLDEAALGSEGRRAAEAHGKVEPLAEEENEVGLAQATGRHVQPRIIDAAWALHGKSRNARG